jgi:hypothetical protein
MTYLHNNIVNVAIRPGPRHNDASHGRAEAGVEVLQHDTR